MRFKKFYWFRRWRWRLWWYKLHPSKEEFHKCFDFDREALQCLLSDAGCKEDYEKYMNDVTIRRCIIHRKTL